MPPSAPTVDDIVAMPTMVSVTWYHPPIDLVDQYFVHWEYVGPCQVPPLVDDDRLDGTVRNFTLADLNPNSQYLLTLEARNGEGSNSSFVIVNTTIEGM